MRKGTIQYICLCGNFVYAEEEDLKIYCGNIVHGRSCDRQMLSMRMVEKRQQENWLLPIKGMTTYHVHGWAKVSLMEDILGECVYDQLRAIEEGWGYDPGVEVRTGAEVVMSASDYSEVSKNIDYLNSQEKWYLTESMPELARYVECTCDEKGMFRIVKVITEEEFRKGRKDEKIP